MVMLWVRPLFDRSMPSVLKVKRIKSNESNVQCHYYTTKISGKLHWEPSSLATTNKAMATLKWSKSSNSKRLLGLVLGIRTFSWSGSSRKANHHNCLNEKCKSIGICRKTNISSKLEKTSQNFSEKSKNWRVSTVSLLRNICFAASCLSLASELHPRPLQSSGPRPEDNAAPVVSNISNTKIVSNKRKDFFKSL